MRYRSKVLRDLYDLIIGTFNNGVEEWANLRVSKKDIKTEVFNFNGVEYTVTKYFIAKEVKMVVIFTTYTFKLKLEISESLNSEIKKKIIVLKYGGVMSSMENMMFEQYSYNVGRRTIQKGVTKMVRHLVDTGFIKCIT